MTMSYTKKHLMKKIDLGVPAPPSGYRKSSLMSRPKGFYP